jgi:hypothetical protein
MAKENYLTQHGLMPERHWREFRPNMVREKYILLPPEENLSSTSTTTISDRTTVSGTDSHEVPEDWCGPAVAD